MKIKPILNHLIVRPDLSEIEKKAKEAGIALPDKHNKEGAAQGTVLFVGPGKRNDSGAYMPMDIKVGDTVFFHRNFTTKVKIGDDEYIAVKEDDCQLAISEEDV